MYKWLKNLKRPRQFIKNTMNERQKRICPVKEIPQFSKYKIEVKTAQDRLKVLETFGYDAKANPSRINWSNFSDECCKMAFFKGAFLTCGTINDPNKGYHLELVCNNRQQAAQVQDILTLFDLDAKIVERKKYFVVYLKEIHCC